MLLGTIIYRSFTARKQKLMQYVVKGGQMSLYCSHLDVTLFEYMKVSNSAI